jgi:hypothetical protein
MCPPAVTAAPIYGYLRRLTTPPLRR